MRTICAVLLAASVVAAASAALTPSTASAQNKKVDTADPAIKAAESARTAVLGRGEQLAASTKELLRLVEDM